MTLTAAELTRVEQMLAARAGLMLDGPGRLRLSRAIDAAAARHGVSAATYAAGIAPDSPALDDLLPLVSVHESAWFRDASLWSTLAEDVLPALIARAGPAPLTLWSAGASHGQEAYSLAILLEELGCPRWRIVASELSPPAAARIRAGRYSERELRGLSPARRARWLSPAGSGLFELAPRLRERVEVACHNICLTRPPLEPGSCALVLCRYVMIYLTPAASAALLARIAGLLVPDGRLAVGAAESLTHIAHDLSVHTAGSGFLYGPPTHLPRPVVQTTPPPPTRPAPRPRTPPADPDPATEAQGLLATGERALAAGELDRAVQAFRGAGYLWPESPLPPLALGLALEAAGDPGAARAFRAAWNALGRSDPDTLGTSLGGHRPEELVHLLADKLAPRG